MYDVYQGWSEKSQVELSSEPDNIAVIKSNRVAVSVIFEEKVCVIDTDTWRVISIIHLHDQCKGLVYFENYLTANCIDEGLVFINEAGQIVKKIVILQEIYTSILTIKEIFTPLKWTLNRSMFTT